MLVVFLLSAPVWASFQARFFHFSSHSTGMPPVDKICDEMFYFSCLGAACCGQARPIYVSRDIFG